MRKVIVAFIAAVPLILSGCSTDVSNIVNMAPGVPVSTSSAPKLINKPTRLSGDLDRGVLNHSLAVDPYILNIQYASDISSDPTLWKTDTGASVNFTLGIANVPDKRIIKVSSVEISTILDGKQQIVLNDSGEFVIGTSSAPTYQNSFTIPAYYGDVSTLTFVVNVKLSVETFEKSSQYMRRSMTDHFRISLIPAHSPDAKN